jgi:hypothetical protein
VFATVLMNVLIAADENSPDDLTTPVPEAISLAETLVGDPRERPIPQATARVAVEPSKRYWRSMFSA